LRAVVKIVWEVCDMICGTIKAGMECIFMKKGGCAYNGGHCHPVVEQCGDCQRIMELPTGRYCLSFPEPQLKWNRGICPLATHVKREFQVSGRKINPLKASKRAITNRG
jgi:hypothetical protein